MEDHSGAGFGSDMLTAEIEHRAFPETTCFNFTSDDEKVDLEFRLIYRGRLKAARSGNTRRKEKHDIRRQIHDQLKELWQQDPVLKGFMEPDISRGGRSVADLKAEDYERYGFRFLPLLRKEDIFTCSLDILFLRRDAPGNVIKSGGDIDNRLKVLMDALRMPDSRDELRGFTPGPGEDPFFCLYEDDVLVTSVKVTTDRLLLPMESNEHVHDVHLVILVKAATDDPKQVPSIRSYSTS